MDNKKYLRILRSLFFKFLYFGRIHSALRINRNSGSILVLCLHRVSNEIDIVWPPLKPDTFERILTYLSENYSVIGFDDLPNNDILSFDKKPKAIISFDDGYLDFKENALPLLLKYNMKANMNIVVNSADKGDLIWTQRLNTIITEIFKNDKKEILINLFTEVTGSKSYRDYTIYESKTILQNILFRAPSYKIKKILDNFERILIIKYSKRCMLNWEDIKQLKKDCNVDIGSHTMTHMPLKGLIDEETLNFEISHSKQVLETKLGVKINTFAFPNGLSNYGAVEVAIKSGYKNILLVGEDYFKFNNSSPFVINRISIYDNDWRETIFRMEGFHSRIKKIYKEVKYRLSF